VSSKAARDEQTSGPVPIPAVLAVADRRASAPPYFGRAPP